MSADWVAIAVSAVAITVSFSGILYTQWKTGRRDIEQWRRNELWKLAASFLSISTERQSELQDYYESLFMGYRGPDRPVTASQKLWQMELLVQQIRLVDSRLTASAEAVYAAHRDADARAAAQDPRDGPMNEVEERLVPQLEHLHNELVEEFQSVSGLRSSGTRWPA